MNGIVEIAIGNDTHTLRFNVQGCAIFEQRAAVNSLLPSSPENVVKLSGDLFYSGLCGQAFRAQKPIPTWDEAMDLFDLCGAEPTFDAILSNLWETYFSSTAGQRAIKQASDTVESAEADKKKAKKTKS